MITLEKLLRTFQIDWQVQTANAFNINCPFCTKRDTKYHCGIFRDMKSFHCFRCGKSGTLFLLLQQITGMSFHEYKAIIKGDKNVEADLTTKDKVREIFSRKITVEKPKTKPVKLPLSELITKKIVNEYPVLQQFLAQRRINIETCEDYGARFTGYTGDYPYRLIIPIANEHGQIVTWQGRDVTGKAKRKYQTAHGVAINQFLYWTDSVFGDDIYIVEGVFDAWRLNWSAVCCFGKSLSKRQKHLLLDASVKRYIIAYDGDAKKEAMKTGQEMACLRNGIGVLDIPEGEDPDSLGIDKMNELSVKWLS